MNTKSFNEALRATARVACCAGLVGLVACESKSTESSIDVDKDTAQVVPEEQQITVPEEPTFDACMEAIDAGFAAADFDTSVLLECCLLATEQVGYENLHNDPQYADLQENCCEEIATQNEFSVACTPWGPPIPPSMSKSRPARA